MVAAVSLIYDVTGNGRVALKTSYGRYAGSGSGPTAANGPVAGNVNPGGDENVDVSLDWSTLTRQTRRI